MELTKEQVILLMEGIGYRKEVVSWDDFGGWIRFALPPSLDEKVLRLIWYKDVPLAENLYNAGNIMFKAGQKFKMLQANTAWNFPND